MRQKRRRLRFSRRRMETPFQKQIYRKTPFYSILFVKHPLKLALYGEIMGEIYNHTPPDGDYLQTPPSCAIRFRSRYQLSTQNGYLKMCTFHRLENLFLIPPPAFMILCRIPGNNITILPFNLPSFQEYRKKQGMKSEKNLIFMETEQKRDIFLYIPTPTPAT